MAENQIKVNNIEELVKKVQEFAASHGGTTKTRIIHSYTNSGEYTCTKNGLVQKTKGRVGVKLEGENNSSMEYFLEDKEEKAKGVNIIITSPELLSKVLEKLGKIGITCNPR